MQDKIFSKSKTWNYSRTYQLWILIRIRVPTKPFVFFYFVIKDKWHSLISPYDKGNNKITEQSSKGKVKTHKYVNRQNQSTTGKL